MLITLDFYGFTKQMAIPPEQYRKGYVEVSFMNSFDWTVDPENLTPVPTKKLTFNVGYGSDNTVFKCDDAFSFDLSHELEEKGQVIKLLEGLRETDKGYSINLQKNNRLLRGDLTKALTRLGEYEDEEGFI